MNTSSEVILNVHDISRIFSKYRGLIALCTLISTALFVGIAQKLPKKYKSHVVLTIYAKYFQSPLIGDFVPGIGESGEMKSQTESLIRQALTPEFLDALGAKYGLYSTSINLKSSPSELQQLRTRLKNLLVAYGLYEPASQESELSEERQTLRARIEIYSLNSTTFNIGFIYNEPRATYAITQDIYNQVIQSLLDVRVHTMANIHDAIRSHLSTLQVPAATPGANVSQVPASSSNPLPVDEELKQVRHQLRVLTPQYTEEHPLIQQLRERERTLVRMQKSNTFRDPASASDSENIASGNGEVARTIYGDLTKKLNYLNIAMDSDRQHQSDYFATLEGPTYPSSPLWPKTPLFVLWGFSLGFFGSVFIAALWEYFDRSALHAGALAHQLGLPLLGELPPFPLKASPQK